jgi:hypothetical protein
MNTSPIMLSRNDQVSGAPFTSQTKLLYPHIDSFRRSNRLFNEPTSFCAELAQRPQSLEDPGILSQWFWFPYLDVQYFSEDYAAWL